MNYLINKFNMVDGSTTELHTFTDIQELPATFLAKWFIACILMQAHSPEFTEQIINRIKVSSVKQSKAMITDGDTMYYIDVIKNDTELRNRRVRQILGITKIN